MPGWIARLKAHIAGLDSAPLPVNAPASPKLRAAALKAATPDDSSHGRDVSVKSL